MSQKNETTVLVLALLITLGLVGGGIWWFTQRLTKPNSETSTSPTSPAPNAGINQAQQRSFKGFSNIQNVPSGLFNYGGSTSWAPIRLSVDSAIQAARPEFRLRYVEPISGFPGSGTGIKMLIDGKLDLAQTSRTILEEEYKQAQQRGFNLQQIPVAIDGLAVAVNPDLNLPGLTLDQLKFIYIAKITNWKELGGPNLKITPYSRQVEAGGTVELFKEDVLGGQAFGSSVEFVSNTTEALRKLAATPGGIYYASAPEVIPQCTIKPLPLGRKQGEFVPPYQEPLVPASQCPAQRNQLNIETFQNGQYPMTRNLFVVVKQNGQIQQQAGEAYANFLLTPQGQKLLTESGFVRIR